MVQLGPFQSARAISPSRAAGELVPVGRELVQLGRFQSARAISPSRVAGELVPVGRVDPGALRRFECSKPAPLVRGGRAGSAFS